MSLLAITCLAIAAFGSSAAENCTSCEYPAVKVEQGWLQGEVLELSTGDGTYNSFKGIPYATPPVGSLRFKAPQPPLEWDGVLNATAHGSRCPHVDIVTEEFVSGSEDCLFLNVYSPDLSPSEPLPVMFFIHGGGYRSGSGNEDSYGPDFLVNHGVVLVTINYRVDALGFLCMDTVDVPGNAGLKDQVMALKWVNNNIAQFGGNPNNITVFGQSAGSASTALHVMSPMSKSLFQRAIAMSGVPFSDWSIAFNPRKRAFVLGKILGFDTNNSTELLEFLQSVPSDQLVNTNPSILGMEEVNNNILKLFHFTPVVEKDLGQDYFLNEDPMVILQNGNVNEVDIIIGYTSMECLVCIPFIESSLMANYNRYSEIFVPRKIQYVTSAATILPVADKIQEYYFGDQLINLDVMKEFVQFASEGIYTYDILRFASVFPKLTTKRYLYKFSCVSERNVYGAYGEEYNITGASHLDDTMYLFDAKSQNLTLDKTGRSYKMIQQTCTLFTNFAKYGNPTPDDSLGAIWQEYDNETLSYMDIDEVLTPGYDVDADVVSFWDSVYDYAEMLTSIESNTNITKGYRLL